jgi:hypothetical protein
MTPWALLAVLLSVPVSSAGVPASSRAVVVDPVGNQTSVQATGSSSNSIVNGPSLVDQTLEGGTSLDTTTDERMPLSGYRQVGASQLGPGGSTENGITSTSQYSTNATKKIPIMYLLHINSPAAAKVGSNLKVRLRRRPFHHHLRLLWLLAFPKASLPVKSSRFRNQMALPTLLSIDLAAQFLALMPPLMKTNLVSLRRPVRQVHTQTSSRPVVVQALANPLLMSGDSKIVDRIRPQMMFGNQQHLLKLLAPSFQLALLVLRLIGLPSHLTLNLEEFECLQHDLEMKRV